MQDKKKHIFYNVLTSNFGTIGYVSVRKLILLNSYLLIGIFAFSLLGIYSLLISQNYPVAIIDIIASISFIWCFFSLRIYKNEQTVISFVSGFLIIFMIVFIALNGNKSFGLVWSFFAPMFLITINGYKRGGVLSILFYLAIIVTLLLGRDTWEDKDIDTLVFTRYIVAYAMSSFVVFMGEYAIFKLQGELEDLSSTDALTKLHNRGKMEEYIEQAFEHKRKTDSALIVVMADIDDFKMINDTYGHHVGDDVLREVSNIFTHYTRGIDMVGRWGGEEFLMIFPNVSLKNAMAMVERLKNKISSFNFPVPTQVTCSFGVCEVKTDSFADKDVLICADDALYRAKKEGKNRICTTTL